MQLTIKVSGDRGSGRTTVMNSIAKHLASSGFTISHGNRDESGNEIIYINSKTLTAQQEKEQWEATPEPTTLAKPKSAIVEAHDIIYGEREETYGDPGKNLRTIAEYWTTHLKAKYGYQAPLTTDDVCVMMVLLKQARLANTPKHRDSITDTIGYMALADRINSKELQDSEEEDIDPYVVQPEVKK
jgi:hypothetical protein